MKAVLVCALGALLSACGNDGDGTEPIGSGGAAGAAAGGAGGTSGAAGAAGSGGAGGGAAGAAGAAGASATCAALMQGPHESERQVPGHADRAYDLFVPSGYDCNVPSAVVLALHGGGGNKLAAATVTCPGDAAEPTDLNAPGCLNAFAEAKGFVVVRPDGTRNPALPNQNIRTFNAGGGEQGYNCTSGYACANDIDEIAYFTALLDAVATVVNVDPKRVFATGLSNGGAMSHKLACLLSDRIAAIGAVGGGNQHAALETCAPGRPVPILQIHGDADDCWQFLGGPTNCVATGNMVAIADVPNPVVGPSTITGWVQRNGCGAAPGVTSLPDTSPGDGTVERATYAGCSQGADVELYTVKGGGHFWPGGYTYNPSITGFKNRDINASEIVLDFFLAHPMP